MPDVPYWVFVCNPKKWAIDRFLDRGIVVDTWGVRPSDRYRFAPGQLAIVRVGVDRRGTAARKGKPKLTPGIYALCEIESEAFPGTGANDEDWAEGQGRAPGWPTVTIRYLRTYYDKPLSIEQLRVMSPEVSPLLLKGHQASSFPIPADNFHAVMELLGEEIELLPSRMDEVASTAEQIAELEKKCQRASPEVKSRVSRSIERGPIGALIKKANGFKCQLCGALGSVALGFKKSGGGHYVEAHHVMPVAEKQVGSLSATNIVTLCPNHHRQVHYGCVSVSIGEKDFTFIVDARTIQIPRFVIRTKSVGAA